MWFGVAPAPAPSPTRRPPKDTHPAQCPCAKHSQLHHRHGSQSPRKVRSGREDLEAGKLDSPRTRSHEIAAKDKKFWSMTKTRVLPQATTRPPRLPHRIETQRDPLHLPVGHPPDNHNNNNNTLIDHLELVSSRPLSRKLDNRQPTAPHESLVYEPLPKPPSTARSRRPSRKTPSSTSRPNVIALYEEPACIFPECPQPQNLVGHTSSVCRVLTTDDRFIVSCSIDGSAKVWSRITYSCLHTLYGHEDTVSCVDLHSKCFVSGSHDRTLRLYSCLQNFRLLHVLRGHTANITRVHFPSHMSSHVLSCSDDATLRLWNGDLGTCVLILQSHASRITSFLVFHETALCSGGADAVVCFWDLRADNQQQSEAAELRQAIKSFRPHKSTVQCLVADAKDSCTWIFSASNDGTIQMFHAKTMEHTGCFDQLHSPIYTMVASGNKLLCSTGDGRVVIYSDLTMTSSAVASKKELALAHKWISSLQLRHELLACSCEDLLYIVDLDKNRVLTVIDTKHHGFINSVAWLHRSKLLTAGQDNVIKLWSTA